MPKQANRRGAERGGFETRPYGGGTREISARQSSPGARGWLALFAGPLLLLVGVLLVVPLIMLGTGSLREGAGILDAGEATGAWSLANYAEIFTNKSYRKALIHSVLLSLGVASVATALCVPTALLFVRHEFRGKRTMRALFTLPMSFSGIVIGFLMVLLIGRIGFIPQMTEKMFGTPLFSGLSYNFWGLALAYLYFEIPRALLTLESALRKFDPTIEAAAQSLGAGAFRRFFWVLLPVMRGALVSTFAVTFSVSLGSFGVALIVSKRFSVLGLEIFQVYTGLLDAPLAAAMSVLLASIALTVNLSLRWIFRAPEARHA